jgi:predicted dehydrogenase
MLRWGLIGCGDIAHRMVAPALRAAADSQLVAVSRADAGRLAAFAATHGVERTYARWQDLVRDADIDAVYVATPPDLHCVQTVAAAEAGKHVLCEKPMALTVDECQRMIDACQANHLTLGIAYYRGFFPVVRRVQQIVVSGEIGRPVIAHVMLFSRFDPTHDHPRGWLGDRTRAGGGPMMDMGCHRIEMLLRLFGPVSDVTPWVGRLRIDRDIDDTATALLQFRSGVHATLSVSWAPSEKRDSVEIFATSGTISIPALGVGTMIVRSDAGERTEHHPSDPNHHQPLVDDFIRAVAERRAPLVSGEIGLEVNRIEAAIYSPETSGIAIPNP